jgi:hypothetical protein
VLDHLCQVQRHPHADWGHDLYETPSVAVEALLRVLPLVRYGSRLAAVVRLPASCALTVTTLSVLISSTTAPIQPRCTAWIS